MSQQSMLKKCELCEKSDENLSLLSANHKSAGWIMVCRDCWIKLYSENRMTSGSGSSSGGLNSYCNSCPGCSFR